MERGSPDLDLLYRGDKEMQVLGEFRGFYGDRVKRL
jgi:hypothetical protein